MEDTLFLEKPFHPNHLPKEFDLKSEDKKHILEFLSISFDGSIVAVKADKVKHFFIEPDIKKIRYGFKARPKSHKMETEEDFYRMLAILIPLEEA